MYFISNLGRIKSMKSGKEKILITNVNKSYIKKYSSIDILYYIATIIIKINLMEGLSSDD